jgi:hypothetical protein
VTSVRQRNRERKRLQRTRQERIVYQTEDWRLFLDPTTLPQKAGCQPDELAGLVLKELVDNALDAGAQVTLSNDGAHWIVADDGSGIEPDQVAELFAVNRPLRSSKLIRLPTRGMLGNGLRVVMAWARELTVETRGVRLTLAVNDVTGRTVVQRRETIAMAPGLSVIVPGDDDGMVDGLARLTLALADQGTVYAGPSQPHWYGPQDMARLLQAAPDYVTAAMVIHDLGLVPPSSVGSKRAHDLAADLDEIAGLLRAMQRGTKTIKPEAIGQLGDVWPGCQGYARKTGIAIEPAGGHVPYVIEASVQCEHAEKKGTGHARYVLILNRSAAVAPLYGWSAPDCLVINGCGLKFAVRAPTGNYTVYLSLITPHVQLTTDGKAPSLAVYEAAVGEVLYKAARQAHARALRPNRDITTKQAAWRVMAQAYLAASSNGTLPANARQIMYAARGDILRLTGKPTLNDQYFTQTLLPGFIEAYPDETASWDVVFDDRGAFTEPHTGRVVPLGTVAVREYLGERQRSERPATVDAGSMAETIGPQNRFHDLLFIEKEGFGALLDHAQIAEMFDLAIMSTKGMSVTAARALIDGLVKAGVERVFVLHDFDVSGFSIFGTLGTSSRRYRFENQVEIVDLGLRLDDVERLGLEAEPSPNQEDRPETWERRQDTLHRHGVSDGEIDFLRSQRVELNAMTSGDFVQFVRNKLEQHDVRKLVPDRDVLVQHARRVMTRALANQRLAAMRSEIERETAAVDLPDDLLDQVEALLQREPALPWDIAVAQIARKVIGEDSEEGSVS